MWCGSVFFISRFHYSFFLIVFHSATNAGPYGNHRLTYRRFPVIVLVSGGIGVTPLISICKDIYRVGDLQNRAPAPHVIEAIYCAPLSLFRPFSLCVSFSAVFLLSASGVSFVDRLADRPKLCVRVQACG